MSEKNVTDKNYEAHAQAHLASIKRDMRKTMEDATVRAMHKVMAEFEAKSDARPMEDWGPGPHEHHSLPVREPEQPAPGSAHYEDGDVFERIGAMKKQPAQQEPVTIGEPVGWHSKQYGFVYMALQPHQFEVGSTLCLKNGTPAWKIESSCCMTALISMSSLPHGTVFYTSPPAQRKPWVGLTDDEILYCVELENPKAIAEEVEAKLKEKNT